MATLIPELMKILNEFVPMVEEKKDIYVSVFISFNGVNINIYPYTDDGEVE